MAITTTNALDALLAIRNDNETARWNFQDAVGSPITSPAGIGNAATVSYSFATAAPSYYSGSIMGFASFSTAQMAAARAVLASISEVADIRFVETAGTGQITFANSSQPGGQAGYAYYPNYSWSTSGSTIVSATPSAVAGDIWLSGNADWDSDAWLPTGDGWGTLLHEVGHAIGLKHPFGSGDGEWVLPGSLDNEAHTVMSYTPAPRATLVTVTGTSSSYQWTYHPIDPSTLMPLDVEALQYLYGANTATRAGNNTYSWTTNAEILQTIWDGGGSDTIDASNQIFTCVIDLQAGAYSSIGLRQTDAQIRQGLDLPSWFTATLPASVYDGSNNLAIARGTVIENAIGGAGNDQITGNTASNKLTGGGGSDSLAGGAGNDTLVGGTGSDSMNGGTGNDTYYLQDAGDVLVEASGAGTDLVYSYLASYTLGANVENGRIMASGTASLTGNTQSNFLYAGAGNNVLAGGSGTDSLSFYYGNNGTGVTASLATGKATGGSGTDTFSGFERLYGTNFADKLTGNAGANLLGSYAGNDVLDGGAGNDTMAGGPGSDLYYVRDAGDVVTEASGGGTDTVHSYLSTYTLGANVENGRILATGTASLTGNAQSNFLYAGIGSNTIAGGGGTDSLSFYYGNNGTGVIASLATGKATGGSGTDSFSGIERLYGTNFGDRLIGDANANSLYGYAGNDALNGAAGNDMLSGGDGADMLVGGAGRDTLSGGSGNDVFDFNALGEMGITSATRDIITDFLAGQDRLDLRTLDAKAGTVADDLFTFIGTAAFSSTNATGQLRYVYDSANACTILYGSVDADAQAEFSVQLSGITSVSSSDILA